jgi:Ti-type conjugative transfer relaxase TraA
MAIYHFSGTIISRSQGRSAVACSAYRSAEILLDEKYGKEHDYSKKEDVVFKEILLPESAPDWMKNREKLWNEVEKAERRKDAQLAREFNFSLPRELTLEQNIELAREFVKTAFVDKGMIADLCIHDDKASDGQSQIHAHVMLTMREVDKEGFGKKVRQWNEKERLLEWRELWAITANKHLEMHDHDIKIDYRSFEAQGIELEPQHKIGPNAAKDRMARMEDHQRIARENGEKILADPSIVLDAITRQQSTFTEHDLARFVNRHTVDPDQFQRVFEAVKRCPELIKIGVDDRGRERFTTQEMLDLESRMLECTYSLSQRQTFSVSNQDLEKVIENSTLSDQQQMVLNHLVEGSNLKLVVGYAGTGKSYLLGNARDVWQRSGYNVSGVSLSGIAVQNLEKSSGIPSRTVASFLYGLDQGRGILSDKDILVIDEAGMLGSRQMERLVSEANRAGAKLVAIGDWQQLQAIEAGAAFRSMADAHPCVELTEVRRQEIAWQKKATIDLAVGHVDKALSAYDRFNHVHEFERQLEAKDMMVSHWNDVRINKPDETQLMLAYLRKDVDDLNKMARDLKQKDGHLGKDHVFNTSTGNKEFAVNDRVYFLKRDDGLGVVNGTLGTIREIKEGSKSIMIELDRDLRDLSPKCVEVDTNFYKHLDHGYAATVYKAQGTTVDRTYMLTSKHYDAHSSYVGMSRHKMSCNIYVSKESFKDKRELVKTLSRNRMKDVTLDYTRVDKEFARQRGVRVVGDTGFDRVRNKQKFEAQKQEKELKEKSYSMDFGDSKFNKAFEEFEREFKKEKPELAKKMDYELKSEIEKKAIDAIAYFKSFLALEMQKKNTEKQKEAFAKTLNSLSKDEKVMSHLRSLEPKVAGHIEKISQAYEKEQRVQSYSYDRGISR